MKLMRLLIYSLISLFPYFSISLAEENKPGQYSITHRILSIEDGLASREVLCGLQDSRGFIWLGTRHGLNRYDGKKFLHFNKKYNNLKGDRIVALAEDDSAFVWILYGTGVNRISKGEVDIIDISTHKITPLSQKFPNMPFSENNIVEISNNANGEVVIHTIPLKIYTWSNKKGFTLVSEEKGIVPDYNIDRFYKLYHKDQYLYSYSHSGQLFVSSIPSTQTNHDMKGLLMLLGLKDNGDCYVDISGKDTPVQWKILTKKGELIKGDFIQNDELKDLNNSKGEHFPFYDPASNSSILYVLREDLYHFADGEFTKLMSKRELELYSSFNPYYYFTDLQGQYWVCTNHGVFIFNITKNRFLQLFTDTKLKINNVTGNSVRGIYEDPQGNVNALIWTNLVQMNKNGNVKVNYIGSENYSMLPYGENLVVSASNLKLIDFKNYVLTNLTPEDTFNLLWSIYPLTKQKILIGGTSGFHSYDLTSKKIQKFIDSTRTFQHGYCYKIIRTKDNRIFAAGQKGIYQLSEKGYITRHFSKTAKDSSSLIPVNDIHDIYEDQSSNFWLATNGEGLFKWDMNNRTFQQFTVENGLSSNVLYCILADERGDLWISSDYGLMRFNPQKHAVKTYTIRDGISNNEFNRISAFQAPDGKMYFGGLNGINAFHPRDFWTDSIITYNAPLDILSFRQFVGEIDQLVDKTEDLLINNKITLEAGDKFFILEFHLFDYTEPFHRYAYKIEGLEKDWTYIYENVIRLSDVQFGEHTLIIKGQNMNGTWSEDQLKIPLIVMQPYYSKLWFISLSFFIFVIIVTLFIRLRTLRLNRDNVRLERTVDERTIALQQSLSEKEKLLKEKNMLLKEIHHRVKNNLQIITSMLELQLDRVKDREARNAIIEGQNRVKSIALIHHQLYQGDTFGTIEFRRFTTELVLQIESVLKNPFKLVIVKNEIPETYLDIETAIPLGLITNELVTNSYKYAFAGDKAGLITFYLEQRSPGNYLFVVSDNGPGLPEGLNIKNPDSLGLKMISVLCKQVSGRLVYQQKDNSSFLIYFKDSATRKMVE